MVLINRYVIKNYSVSHQHPGKIMVSVKIERNVIDEADATVRASSFRAEWISDTKLQQRADLRGASPINKLSWNHADVEELVKEWLTEKRYPDPTNVTTLKVPLPAKLPPGV